MFICSCLYAFAFGFVLLSQFNAISLYFTTNLQTIFLLFDSFVIIRFENFERKKRQTTVIWHQIRIFCGKCKLYCCSVDLRERDRILLFFSWFGTKMSSTDKVSWWRCVVLCLLYKSKKESDKVFKSLSGKLWDSPFTWNRRRKRQTKLFVFNFVLFYFIWFDVLLIECARSNLIGM